MIIQLAICISWYFISGTVDGRNPAPVDMVNIPVFSRFYIYARCCRISSINSICTANWELGIPIHLNHVTLLVVSQESASCVDGGKRSNFILAGKIREEQKPPKNSWKILKKTSLSSRWWLVIVSNMFCLGFRFYPWEKMTFAPHFFPQQHFSGSCRETKRRATFLNFHLVELVSVFFLRKGSPSWIYRAAWNPKANHFFVMNGNGDVQPFFYVNDLVHHPVETSH